MEDRAYYHIPAETLGAEAKIPLAKMGDSGEVFRAMADMMADSIKEKMCIRDSLNTWQKEKKTCFFITHDVDEAIILGQRCVIMSARPGRIKRIVDIDIPYPRTQETRLSPEFNRLKNEVWGEVYKEYLEVRK